MVEYDLHANDFAVFHFAYWHVADLGQRLTCIRDAANSGHVSEAGRPTLMTQGGCAWFAWSKSGPAV
jgi:hypothetical protein